MNIGMPEDVSEEVEVAGIPCDQLDTAHKLFAYEETEYIEKSKKKHAPYGARCYPQYVDWPYGSLVTTYGYGKKVAAQIIQSNWLLGTGYASYPEYVEAIEKAEFGDRRVASYRYPHCTYLTEFATAGILGMAAFLFFIVSIFQMRPNAIRHERGSIQERAAIWLGVIGFLLIGINLDVMTTRSFWFLLAILLGIEMDTEVLGDKNESGSAKSAEPVTD